jgi:hypothetical protein
VFRMINWNVRKDGVTQLYPPFSPMVIGNCQLAPVKSSSCISSTSCSSLSNDGRSKEDNDCNMSVSEQITKLPGILPLGDIGHP